MTTRRLAVAGILLAAWATVAAATRGQVNQFAGVALTTTHVAGNVYMVQRPGGGGNVGAFVGPDGVLLVEGEVVLPVDMAKDFTDTHSLRRWQSASWRR
jgi:hypothetical protein